MCRSAHRPEGIRDPKQQRYIQTREYGDLLATEHLGPVSPGHSELRYLVLFVVQFEAVVWIYFRKNR